MKKKAIKDIIFVVGLFATAALYLFLYSIFTGK